MTTSMVDERVAGSERFPLRMCEMRTMRNMPELRLIESTHLRHHLSEELRLVYEDGAVTTVAWFDRPEGVLISMEMWALGCERRPVEDMLVERLGTREARTKLKVLGDELHRGKHAVMSVWREDRAVLVPYDWARGAFPEWDLPEDLKGPPKNTVPDRPCVQVVYRKSRTVQQLLAEFAEANNPKWEIDRRLSSTAGQIPLERRPWLRGVVYVEDGVVVRVRSLDPDGAWEKVADKVSLAPVSAALTREQIDEAMPTLRMYPGDQRLAPQGAPREYVDL